MQTMPMTPGEFFEILKRRKWGLIITTAIIFMVSAVVAVTLPSIYQATSTILVEEQEVPADYVKTTVTSYVEQRLQSINQRIMSYSRLLEIIQRFNLYPELQEKWTNEEIVAKMREDTVLKPISTNVINQRTGRRTSATIAFSLSYEGKTPHIVQQITNVLTSLFLQENLQLREKQVQETTDFLEGEMDRVKEDLDQIEAEIADFKETHITELPELLNMNLQTLSTIERNIDRVRERLGGLREKEQYLQVQLASIPPYVDGAEVSKQNRLDQLKVELVRLTNRFSEEYPDVKKIRTEIGELEKQLAEADSSSGTNNKPPDNPTYISLSAQLASTRADIGASSRQLEELFQDADKYRGRIEAIPRVEESYKAMLGERANIRAKYEDLMRKNMEARLAHGLEKEQKGERFTLIEPARMPGKQSKPNRKAIMLIGLVLGLGAGVGFAALREFSDDTVRSADSLADTTKFPVLAGIPLIMTKKDIARRRFKRVAWVTGTVGAIVGGVAVFHFMVMDLYIFWAKLMRKLAI